MSRQLGPLERLMAVRAQLGLYTNVWVSAELDQPVDLNVLYQAVADLIMDEPMLGVVVTGRKEKDLRFTKLKGIRISDAVSLEHFNEENIANIHTQLHDIQFDLQGDKPLWRVFPINKGKEIVFVYDHTPLDGMSGASVCVKLAKACQNVRTPSVSRHDVALVSGAPIPPPLEGQMNVSVPYWKLCVALMEEYAKPLCTFATALRRLVYSKEVDQYRFGTGPKHKRKWTGRYSLVDIDKAKTKRLLDACHKNQVSASAVLFAVLVSASSDTLYRHYPVSSSKMRANARIPYNARQFIRKEQLPSLGCMVGDAALDTVVPPPKNVQKKGYYQSQEFYDIARGFRTSVLENVAKSRPDDCPAAMHDIGMIQFVPSIKDFFDSHTEGAARSELFSISNLCAVDPCGTNIERLRFSQCTGANCAFLQFGAVGVKGGSISVSISAADDPDDCLGDLTKEVQRFVDQL
ncbi:hypothetical protein CJU89_2232 [Yarrowia sp. B02]|nr:hypothetical protein CJU89_2232 [Yarrowia sp. B02]